MRARYYNPQKKRFINQDILTGNIGNNKSLNRYSYVEGNPVSYTDPFGLSPYQKISEGIHTTLEALGSIPGVGNFFDWVNVGYYVLEGNLPQAFQATIYAMPYGDLAKLKKYAPKVLGLFGGAEIASHMLQDAGCDNIQTIFSSETRQYSHFGEYEDTSQLTTEESLAIALDNAMLAMNITSSFKTPVNWKVDGGDVNVGRVDGGSSGYRVVVTLDSNTNIIRLVIPRCCKKLWKLQELFMDTRQIPILKVLVVMQIISKKELIGVIQ